MPSIYAELIIEQSIGNKEDCVILKWYNSLFEGSGY